VRMPIADIVQPIAPMSSYFLLFGRSIREIAASAAGIALTRTRRQLEDDELFVDFGEKLPASFGPPREQLAVLPKVFDDTICQNKRLARSADRISHHAAANLPQSQSAWRDQTRSRTMPPLDASGKDVVHISENSPPQVWRRLFLAAQIR
jgi:hypothetical protein